MAFLSAYEKLYDPWKELMDYYQELQDSRVRYNQVMSYFDGIRPCGLTEPVVSLAELLATPPTMEQMKQAVVKAFGDIFSFEMTRRGDFPV